MVNYHRMLEDRVRRASALALTNPTTALVTAYGRAVMALWDVCPPSTAAADRRSDWHAAHVRLAFPTVNGSGRPPIRSTLHADPFE